MPDDMLSEKEPDEKQLHKSWLKDPSPHNATAVLSHLQPTIDRAITAYGGGKNDALMRSRAKQLTLKAMGSYDPQRDTRLSTHVMNHLQGLRRVSRQQQQVLHTPDRVALDQAFLHKSQAELEDQLGREPSTIELSDYTKLSPQKITRTRRYVQGVPEGSLPEDVDISSHATPFDAAARQRKLAQLLHEELLPRDQQVLEWSLGLYGKPQLDNQTIAARLRVTPGAISQRKQLIQQKLDQLMSM